MKQHILLASVLMTSSAFAANFGKPGAGTATTAPVAAPVASVVVTPPLASGPQAASLFRVVKTDGSTLIQQGMMAADPAAASVLTVSEADALAKGVGKCAFNVKYDELSSAAAVNTTNRLFSNDKAIAINSKIDLAPGVMRTIWTQPYLFSGMNNVRVVINADGAAPSTKWIRINVLGPCGGTGTSTASTATTTVTVATTTTTTASVFFKPGSGEWNNLNVVFGYSNFALTQLKGKGYPRYDNLARLNAAVTAVINAKTVERGAYNSLMTAWNTFVTDPAFKKMMEAASSNTDKKK